VNSLPSRFSEVPLLHKVRTAPAFCLNGIGKKMLKQFWKSERHYNTQPKQGVNQRRLSQKKLRYRDTNRGKQGRVRSPEFSLPQSGGIHAVRQQPQTAAMLISPRLWQRRALRWQTQRLFRRRDKIWIAREMTGASPTFAQNFV
jgi:hypothetical protein